MKISQPDTARRKINLLKRFIFYINVSTFRVINIIPGASDNMKNYHTRGLSVAFIIFTEFVILNYYFPHLDYGYFKLILGIAIIYHGAIDVFFNKDILEMSENYNSYYNKVLFYLFFIFIGTGMVGGLTIFNNQIGHVAK